MRGFIRFSVREEELRQDSWVVDGIATEEEFLATEPEAFAVRHLAPMIAQLQNAIRERKSR